MLYDLNNITIAKDGEKIVLTMTPEWFTQIFVYLLDAEAHHDEHHRNGCASRARELINRFHELDEQIDQQ